MRGVRGGGVTNWAGGACRFGVDRPLSLLRRRGLIMSHPMQPVYRDAKGVIRFRPNKIIRWFLDNKEPLDLNKIAGMAACTDLFTREDQVQLAQLIGYSVSGFHELSYVTDAEAAAASALAKAIEPASGGCRDTGCPIHCDATESDQ